MKGSEQLKSARLEDTYKACEIMKTTIEEGTIKERKELREKNTKISISNQLL